MKRTYRFLSLLLSFALAISLLPQVVLPVSADTSGSCGEEGYDIRWTFEAATGTLTIQGGGYMAYVFENDESPWYGLRDQIRTLILPEGLLNIGRKAFFGCGALTSVTIPDSVILIGEDAFRECASLTSVKIGNGVTSIGVSAFQDCGALTSVMFGSGLVEINAGAFFNCALLEDAAFPDSLTFLGSYSFAGCETLTCVEIPDGVYYVGENVFYACTSLTNVTIPDSLTYLGMSAFGDTPVYDDPENWTDGVLYLGHWVISSKTGQASVVIREGTVGMSAYAFFGRTSLESVMLPDGLTFISDFAFSSCTALTEVTIPGSVTRIGDAAFNSCVALTSVTILEGVTSICDEAFFGCPNLKRVTIPESVTTIDYAAFGYFGDEYGFGAYPVDDFTICGYNHTAAQTYAEENNFAFVSLGNPTPEFTDVQPNAYYADAVKWAVKNGITTGLSDTCFGPKETCTRAQIVTFLWRAAGSPEPTTTNNPFTDLKDSKYYYKAVLWAAETDVTSGTSETTFSPKNGCTRAQIVTFLWRFAGSPEPTMTTNPFTDVPAGKYYSKAVLWAAEKGVTAGTSATTFGPNDTCIRGQVVTFLYRYFTGG